MLVNHKQSSLTTKKLSVFLQCVLAFFPIVNLVSFYRIDKIGKGILILLLSLFLFGMFAQSFNNNCYPCAIPYLMGKQPLDPNATKEYYDTQIAFIASLPIIAFGLPVWFVRKWTRKWNTNIDKQTPN
jgi:hypothetical protein